MFFDTMVFIGFLSLSVTLFNLGWLMVIDTFRCKGFLHSEDSLFTPGCLGIFDSICYFGFHGGSATFMPIGCDYRPSTHFLFPVDLRLVIHSCHLGLSILLIH